MTNEAAMFLIFACGLCGIVMVCGSIWLLKTGVIKLNDAIKGAGGITIEILDKVKVSTTYPALALFLIGLLFLGLGLWFAKRPSPLNIVGKFEIDDPSVISVSVQPDIPQIFKPDSNGELDTFLPTDALRWNVVINAAGYTPQAKFVRLRMEDVKWNRITLKDNDLRFTRTAAAVTPIPAPIPAISPGVNLEPFQKP